MESSDKVVETVIVGNYVEMEADGKGKDLKSKLSKFFWDGGSTYDAWFSCASNQVGKLVQVIYWSDISSLGACLCFWC